MGKGGGCVPSKKKHPSTTTPPPQPTSTSTTTSTSTSPTRPAATLPTAPLKLLIVFYSMYGHVEQLARRMKKGVDSVPGVQGLLYRVPETLSIDVLSQMKAPLKDDSIPEISSPDELLNGAGFLFGFPTRYGSMSSQMKAFFDSTAHLSKDQALAGKPAGFFVSTGTQGGGQETTAV